MGSRMTGMNLISIANNLMQKNPSQIHAHLRTNTLGRCGTFSVAAKVLHLSHIKGSDLDTTETHLTPFYHTHTRVHAHAHIPQRKKGEYSKYLIWKKGGGGGLEDIRHDRRFGNSAQALSLSDFLCFSVFCVCFFMYIHH